jgi:adenosyl cobinamide kinase/adenosyl cobinamide phosphate guanylyltransferase
MPIILVGGGSRSGKSRYALELARQRGTKLGFLATAQALDSEMESRIAHHQKDRGPEFETIEEPFDLLRVIEESKHLDILVIDCLTLWISNMMLSGRDTDPAPWLDSAVRAPLTTIIVTNEVGCGIVPENELARRFRDVAGWANQSAGAKADEVYWMVFGIPMRVK